MDNMSSQSGSSRRIVFLMNALFTPQDLQALINLLLGAQKTPGCFSNMNYTAAKNSLIGSAGQWCGISILRWWWHSQRSRLLSNDGHSDPVRSTTVLTECCFPPGLSYTKYTNRLLFFHELFPRLWTGIYSPTGWTAKSPHLAAPHFFL